MWEDSDSKAPPPRLAARGGKEGLDVFGITEEGLGLTRFVDGNGWL